MAAALVAGNPAFRSTNSNESRKPRQDQGGLPEAYADMQHNAEDPRSRAAVDANALGNINVDLVQEYKK
jgi:hypothetical protein